ncbi:E3 ubiquitin-protein ligase RAD18 [Aspergillus chevalieri]|uniref:Postreplication repair E3 ubiquitin-protein ligase RAD18 n=1 Tax=Aspergillus chevalieri TaxID=182096 RepID=A0A7R7VTE7_ASPCH|nr:E3 ubiquitin-protein ligase rad18 [Aspergillus chevalieri]BCR90434.1 E3 ubiquitin-protein ligase rad18 [Aspergillus chevalieri]
MDTPFDIPDSTDWLDTPLSLLAPLESSLRCQVCKDFFDNPVITSCSHTFCSLCIRRCLSTEGKCPVCRSSDQETKLRRNWIVQELLEAFQNARPSILDLARKARDGVLDRVEVSDEPSSKKRKIEQSQVEGEGVSEVGAEGIVARSQSRQVDNHPQPAMVDLVEDSQDEDFAPDDGLVACPICNRRMKNEAVFPHLETDACGKDPAPPKKVSYGSLQPMSPVARRKTRTIAANANNKPERLPAINYSILKEGVLRKKLKDLGIPNWGPRQLLQRRHTEWMNLWNANCDSKSPKSKWVLLRELDSWERTQGGSANPPSHDSNNTIMEKNFDKAAWSTSHDNDFKRLIENARKKNDAVRGTISQGPIDWNESETAPIPERPAEEPAVLGEAPESGESQIAPPNLNGVENQSQPTQNGHVNLPMGLP